MYSTFSRLALKEMYCKWQGELIFFSSYLRLILRAVYKKEQSTLEIMEISLNSF